MLCLKLNVARGIIKINASFDTLNNTLIVDVIILLGNTYNNCRSPTTPMSRPPKRLPPWAPVQQLSPMSSTRDQLMGCRGFVRCGPYWTGKDDSRLPDMVACGTRVNPRGQPQPERITSPAQTITVIGPMWRPTSSHYIPCASIKDSAVKIFTSIISNLHYFCSKVVKYTKCLIYGYCCIILNMLIEGLMVL